MLDVERIDCLGHQLSWTFRNALYLCVKDKYNIQSSSHIDDHEVEDNFDDSVSMNSDAPIGKTNDSMNRKI